MASFAPYELHFDNVRIPADRLIGAEGQGFSLASDFLVHGRIIYPAGPIGIAQCALDMACAWARDRDVFGGKLADKQGIQWMLVGQRGGAAGRPAADVPGRLERRPGRDVRVDASVAKMFGTEAAYKFWTGASRSTARWALRPSCRWSAGSATCGSSGSAKEPLKSSAKSSPDRC